jgi:acyl dehydratase
MSAVLQPKISLFGTDTPEVLVGQTLGTSPWFKVEQTRIDSFARNTNDWDIMHVDPAWCKDNSPFGKPIAFGFQTLSMLTFLMNETIARPDDQAFALNYGFNRVRLMNAVTVDSEIRATFVLNATERREGREWLHTLGTTVEIKGQSKPAMVADWLVLMSRKA